MFSLNTGLILLMSSSGRHVTTLPQAISPSGSVHDHIPVTGDIPWGRMGMPSSFSTYWK